MAFVRLSARITRVGEHRRSLDLSDSIFLYLYTYIFPSLSLLSLYFFFSRERIIINVRRYCRKSCFRKIVRVKASSFSLSLSISDGGGEEKKPCSFCLLSARAQAQARSRSSRRVALPFRSSHAVAARRFIRIEGMGGRAARSGNTHIYIRAQHTPCERNGRRQGQGVGR